MVENHRWGGSWRATAFDVERFHPIADGDMGDLIMFDFSVAQPFQIQLQRLGNIVVYFFADFVNGKKVVAFCKDIFVCC
jgi:hypothetical protein